MMASVCRKKFFYLNFGFFDPIMFAKPRTLGTPHFLRRSNHKLKPRLFSFFKRTKKFYDGRNRINLVFFFRIFVQPKIDISLDGKSFRPNQSKFATPSVPGAFRSYLVHPQSVILHYLYLRLRILRVHLGFDKPSDSRRSANIKMDLSLQRHDFKRKPEPYRSLPILFLASFHAPMKKSIGDKKLHSLRRTNHFPRRNNLQKHKFDSGNEILSDIMKPDLESDISKKDHR